MAITDRGTLWKVPEFVQIAAQMKVMPIIGCEVQVVMINGETEESHPLVLLAENELGYLNLVRLVSLTQTGFKASGMISFAALRQHVDGLVALSGGQQSLIAHLVRDDRRGEASEVIADLADAFNFGRFFIELQHTGAAKPDQVNIGLEQMAHTLGLRTVATVDLRAWSRNALGVEVILGTDSGTRCWTECYHLLDAGITGMLTHMSAFPSAIKNTVKVADMCRFDFPAGARRRPPTQTPFRCSRKTQSLASSTRSGLRKRLEDPPPSSRVAML